MISTKEKKKNCATVNPSKISLNQLTYGEPVAKSKEDYYEKDWCYTWISAPTVQEFR